MTAIPDISAAGFHRRYLDLVDEIETLLPVAAWRAADLDIWPLARMDLYLSTLHACVGAGTPPSGSLLRKGLERYATSAVHLWKSRRDLRHWIARPQRADAVMLGDGVSLDRIDGSWHDRYCEPLIAALARRGCQTFLMQAGDLSRLPWHRPTYGANIVVQRALRRQRSIDSQASLPGRDALCRLLAARGFPVTAFSDAALNRRAGTALAMASEFEHVLRIVRPSLAFVVTYYADLGPAFLLACRRQGILSVDLQHCPQEGAHKAYGWSAVPERGYSVLPSVFWHWSAADAHYVQRWTSRLTEPWHRAIHGGHLQLMPFLDDRHPGTLQFDARFRALAGERRYEREVLVALQPVVGFDAQWRALASLIRAAPSGWRWWIRRHPASRAFQDDTYRDLISLQLPNVVIEPSSRLPLPALLRHISVVVSRNSGAAAEAAQFGVPALFLSDEARDQFAGQIDRGSARVVKICDLERCIAELPARTERPQLREAPPLDYTLSLLWSWSRDYRRLCQQRAASPLREAIRPASSSTI